MAVIAIGPDIVHGEDARNLFGIADDAHPGPRGEWPRQIGPDRLPLVHRLEFEELQGLGYYLGRRKVGEMEPGLPGKRHGKPHALRTEGIQHAPAGDVAKALESATNRPLGVNGADPADNMTLVANQEAVVGLARIPALCKGFGPLRGRPVAAQILGQECAEPGQVLIADRFNGWQGHCFGKTVLRKRP